MKTFKTVFTALVVLIAVASLQPLKAQNTKDIFTDGPITYLGIDFSKAKLIGDAGADAYAIKTRIFSSINQVIVNEPKKYDVGKAMRKSNVNNDIGVTEAQNAKVVEDSIKTYNSSDFKRFTPATIDKMVKTYNFNGKKGIGMAFIVEALSKEEEKAAVWVTFVNMATGKVLLTERMLGEAGGFGFRNYWAKPFAEILKDIEKSKYKQWSSS